MNPRKPVADAALDCVHCGLCLPVCPTYLELGDEADSPRGRIYLMRAYAEGRHAASSGLLQHLDRCLVCRACETACPSGVQFGAMMEDVRAELLPARPALLRRPWRQRLHAALGAFVLLRILPYRNRLHLLVQGLRLYQSSALGAAVRRLGLARALGLGAQEALAPAVPPARLRRAWPAVLPPDGPRRARVLFLRGCVAPEVLPEMYTASLAALRHNGVEVVTPPEQSCCGALHFHAGFRAAGLDLLARNVRGFDLRDVDAVVVNAAGCGSTLKEYGALAAARPELATAAEAFAAQVRDISEFLHQLGINVPTHPVARRVTYDEPCHLLHGQRVSAAPRAILGAIPGLELLPLPDADRCCGSAGVYNLVQGELAGAIQQEKIRNIVATGAEVVATGNPGCILQIRAGLAQAAVAVPQLQRVRVVHPMALLALAYGEDASTLGF